MATGISQSCSVDKVELFVMEGLRLALLAFPPLTRFTREAASMAKHLLQGSLAARASATPRRSAKALAASE